MQTSQPHPQQGNDTGSLASPCLAQEMRHVGEQVSCPIPPLPPWFLEGNKYQITEIIQQLK